MKTVKVQKSQLLLKLQENFEKHKKEHFEAMKDRQQLIVATLEAELETFLSNKSYDGQENYHFPKPKSYVVDYQRAIQMVEMSVDSEIVLDQHEFDCYVMDNWHWKDGFLAATRIYK